MKEETQRREKAENLNDSLHISIQQQDHQLRNIRKKTDTTLFDLHEKKLSGSKEMVKKLKYRVAERDSE